jgi:hypothetical protein
MLGAGLCLLVVVLLLVLQSDPGKSGLERVISHQASRQGSVAHVFEPTANMRETSWAKQDRGRAET